MKTIRGKMLLWFSISLFVLLSILGLINYLQVRDTIVPLTKDLSQQVLVARAAEIGKVMQGYIADINTMSRRTLIQRGNWNEIEIDLLDRAEMINGDYEMLFFADSRGTFFTSTGSIGNISDRDYYIAIIKDGQDRFVSNPVISRATGEHVFVVASVVIHPSGERIGLIAATILLSTLTDIAASINIGEKGFGYIVDDKGLLIAHPNEDLRMNLNLLTSEELGFKGLKEVGEQMVAGETGMLSYKRPDESKLVAIYNPIPLTPNWSLGIALYEEELMGEATGLMRTIILLMLGIILAMLIVVFFISKQLATPIMSLKEGAQAISAGHLDLALDIHTGDEIEELASAFNTMTSDLKEHIKNLQQTTAEKERIESELSVANKIQSSMLPRIFPPYPEMKDLDLYATMEPAREVGGDFYDFFLIDSDRLCFSIGDVSGKGIPAALFMVITRTILKNLALQDMDLPEILNQTNNMLCAENIENMFVTLFMGIINTKTQEMEYTSAGHNPPLIGRRGGEYEYLEVPRCLVLGGMEDYMYQSKKILFNQKDTLFLYTDGVTEAMNHRGELFSDQKLIDSINALEISDVTALIEGIQKEIDHFVGDTPASDDITMLALSLVDQK